VTSAASEAGTAYHSGDHPRYLVWFVLLDLKFSVVFCLSLFVLLVIVLVVILRLTASDCLFVIFLLVIVLVVIL
jgi:hypothetical protein